MKYIFSLVISLTLSFSSISHAQVFEKVGSDIVHFFNTGGDLVTDFSKFQNPTPLYLAGSIGAIGAAYSIDYNTQSLALKNQSSFNDKLFSIDKVYGSGYTLIGIAGLYGYGIIFNNDQVRKIGLETIEAVGYAGIITSVLKTVAGRYRPYMNEGKFKFNPINFSAGETSFPSGHSTVAFAVSTVLAKNTDNVYLKILCYSGSGLVAAARLYHNAHWFSDVVTGGLIGYFVGDYVSNHDKKHNPNGTNFSLLLSPNAIGFSLTF